MSEPGMKTCPECAEEIKLEAKVCRYCGTTFSLLQVGYCTHDHKVTAASELGVCVICNSPLIDVHLESKEIAGPTVGAGEKDSAAQSSSVAMVVPVLLPGGAEGAEEEEEEEPEEEELASPPPVLPAGFGWKKPSITTEPPAESEEPLAADESPEEESPEEEEAEQTSEPRSSDVAERLAAFGRPAIPISTPPAPPASAPGPPVAPPPGPPSTIPPIITPSAPVSSSAAQQGAKATASAPPPHVDLLPEATKEDANEEAPAAPVATTGSQRVGIVPSLAHRIAHPLFQLAAIAVILVWLLEFYWNRSLRGTSHLGSKTLSHLVVATYGSDKTLLIAVQVAIVAAICGLLAPTRLLPKGWFRDRYVSRAFTKELYAKLGVKLVYRQKWYLQKMFCAFAIWAIALAYFVADIARKASVDLKVGGYITAVALITGFASSAVLMTRRTPLVTVDEQGRIGSSG